MNIHDLSIKIVIWDLDETFWSGTLSEEGVTPIERNIELIKFLTDRGVINSISSKNDYEQAKSKLVELGVWDYFVFPHINWEPKGPQISHLLDECSLRAQNALFIDDNLQNLHEAVYYNEGLMTCTPEDIEDLFNIQGKMDCDHSRLKQYKLLQAKHEDSLSFGSNEAFLRASNIRVIMKNDCLNHLDRILDLVNRSNQLNYTKKRLNANELAALVTDENVKTGYVEVYDSYGEYGIVGFYAIRGNKAEHFLFSCRTIGMGIEQFVYAMLAYPKLEIIGEVRNLVTLDKCPDWIVLEDIEQPKQATVINRDDKPHILISGGCDLEQMAAYLKNDSCNVDYKFNVQEIRHDHTVFMVGAKKYSKTCLAEMIRNLPFVGKATFDTSLYDEKYNVVVISLLMDYTQAVFEKNDSAGVYVAYGDYDLPVTPDYRPELFDQKQHAYLMNNYHLIGRIPDEVFLSNLETIRQMIPRNTVLILINGGEIQLEHAWEKERYLAHRHYNNLVDSFVSTSSNTYLLDMRKIVTKREHVTNNIRHYSRAVYYEMAKELSRLINSFAEQDLLRSCENKRGIFWEIRMKFRKLIDLLFYK